MYTHAGGLVAARNSISPTRDALEQQLVTLNDAARSIADAATAAGRPVSASEEQQISNIHQSFALVEAEIERLDIATTPRRLTRPGPMPISAHSDPAVAATPVPFRRTGSARQPSGAASGLVQSIVASEGFQAVCRGAPSSGLIEIPGSTLRSLRNDVYSDQQGGSPNSGWSVTPAQYPGVGNDPRRGLPLLAALPHLPVAASNSFEYHELSGFSQNAGYQATEGAAKNQTTVPLTIKSAQIKTIAHFERCSRQVLADVAQLTLYVSNLLRHGVLSRLESEIVAGTSGIVGLVSSANVYAPAATLAADQISETLADLSGDGWNPDLILLNPTDWHRVRTERATTDEYVTPGWSMPPAPSMWGVQVIASPSLTAGTAIVMDTSCVAILDREMVSVAISTEDGDNFTTNRVTIRAEGRWGFAPFSTAGIRKVTLTF